MSRGLLGLLGLALVAVVVAQPAERPAVASGPMLGHITDTSARVWVQLDRRAAVGIEVRPSGSHDWRPLTASGQPHLETARADRRLAVVLTVQGLQPSTRYEYRLIDSLGPLPAATDQSFRTAAVPGAPEDLRVAFGSCIDAQRYPDAPVFAAIDRRRPDVFLFLGDNVYLSSETAAWDDPALIWEHYRQGRALPTLQPLLRHTACYAIWDDHDYGPNNSDKLYALRHLSLSIFATYWANPSYGSDGVPGVWHRFVRGRVELFLLDGRYHRDPSDGPDDEHKTQWGAAQRDWLEKGLRRSRAAFKVIASGGQFLSRYHRFESLDQYHHERQWLIDLLQRHRIGGVVLLSGDRHLGEVLRWLPPEVPYPLYELTSSPLAAGIASTASPPDQQVPDRLPGSLVLAENFGELVFSAMGSDDPQMDLQLYGGDGVALGPRVKLHASELQPRGPENETLDSLPGKP